MEKQLSMKLKSIKFQREDIISTDKSIENYLKLALNEYSRAIKEAKQLKLQGIRTIPEKDREYLKQLKEID